ncbi:hypothetical protein LXL04_005947 [Taraxacum kok-saghyz]
MGCGKSKHAVVTETTIVKSTKSDDGKETRKTKTVTEKGDSISVQEVETTSSVVEDTKKETTTTKIDPTGTAAANVGVSAAPTSADEDQEVHDVVPTDDVDVVKAVKEDEDVKDSIMAKTTDKVSGSNDGVKDDEKKESTTTDEKEVKTENVAPTLMENVTKSSLVVKGDKRFKDPKEEMVYETPMKANDDFSTPRVAPAKDSTKVETKKEEDVMVTEADIVKAETSSAVEPNKVLTNDEAKVAETKDKET